MNAILNDFVKANQVAGGAILSIQDITALNYLIKGLVNLGVWSSNNIIFPFAGSDVITHSINLVNPSIYNFGFTDTANHTTQGWSTSSKTVSGWNLGTRFGRNLTIGIYCNSGSSANASNNFDIFSNTAASSTIRCNILNSSTQAEFDLYTTSGERITAASSTANILGFHTFNASNGTNSIVRNGTQLVSTTVTTTGTLSNSNIVFCSTQTGNGSAALNRRYASYCFMDNVPAEKQAGLYTVWQTYHTIKGTNV